jgi:hypothetical protein
MVSTLPPTAASATTTEPISATTAAALPENFTKRFLNAVKGAYGIWNTGKKRIRSPNSTSDDNADPTEINSTSASLDPTSSSSFSAAEAAAAAATAAILRSPNLIHISQSNHQRRRHRRRRPSLVFGICGISLSDDENLCVDLDRSSVEDEYRHSVSSYRVPHNSPNEIEQMENTLLPDALLPALSTNSKVGDDTLVQSFGTSKLFLLLACNYNFKPLFLFLFLFFNSFRRRTQYLLSVATSSDEYD